MKKIIRVLVAKPGLDGHDRGAKIIAKALKEAGMEVIYTGLHQTTDMIARTATDEDVDVIGLSILSGAHNELAQELIEKLKNLNDGKLPLIILGGIIPEEDHAGLLKLGVGAIFTPGSSLEKIKEFIVSKVV